jgi:hypothetical protein
VEQGSGSGVREWSAGHGRRRADTNPGVRPTWSGPPVSFFPAMWSDLQRGGFRRVKCSQGSVKSCSQSGLTVRHIP